MAPRAQIAPRRALAAADRDVQHRDRRLGGARHGDRDLGAAARGLGAVDRHQDAELGVGFLQQIVAHRRRPPAAPRSRAPAWSRSRGIPCRACDGLLQPDDHEVVALLGFRGDDLGRGRFVHDGGDVDRRVGLLLLLLLALDLLGRLLDGLAGLLRLLFLLRRRSWLAPSCLLRPSSGWRPLWSRSPWPRSCRCPCPLCALSRSWRRPGCAARWSACRACRPACRRRARRICRSRCRRPRPAMRSRLGTKPLLLQFLALEPLLFLLAHRNARQRPAQRRRHGHGGDHRHGDDHGEEVLVERAHRQADGGDDHLGRAARVHAAGEREAFARRQPAELGAGKGAAELADAGDDDQAGGQQRDLAVGEDGQIGAASPPMPKNTGTKKAVMMPRNCSSI